MGMCRCPGNKNANSTDIVLDNNIRKYTEKNVKRLYDII